MINLACEVSKISNECSCLEIFDHKVIRILPSLGVIPYFSIIISNYKLKICFSHPIICLRCPIKKNNLFKMRKYLKGLSLKRLALGLKVMPTFLVMDIYWARENVNRELSDTIIESMNHPFLILVSLLEETGRLRRGFST